MTTPVNDADDPRLLLREILDKLGSQGIRPSDPAAAARWDMPLIWHLTHHAESLHSLRNFVQILTHNIEKLESKLDRNETTNQAILDLSRDLARLNENIRASSTELRDYAQRISEQVGVVVADKPLLMRDLWHIDTNIAEIIITVTLLCEGLVFSAGADALLRSALFSTIGVICQYPIAWAVSALALGIGSICSFISRRYRLRVVAAAFNMVYFGVTGGLTLFLQPGVLGWIPHMIAFGVTFWIFFRGPSRAI